MEETGICQAGLKSIPYLKMGAIPGMNPLADAYSVAHSWDMPHDKTIPPPPYNCSGADQSARITSPATTKQGKIQPQSIICF